MLYITTPLFYPNAKPHIGTIFSNIIAGIIFRYSKQRHIKVHHITGLDVHGRKMYSKILKEGLQVRSYISQITAIYKNILYIFGSYTKFIVTHSRRHFQYVTDRFSTLSGNTSVYSAYYTGGYDSGSEALITHTSSTEKSMICLFLRPSFDFKIQLKSLLKYSYFYYKEAMNIYNTWVDDLCLTRYIKWGVPAYPYGAVYVWLEALLGYVAHTNYNYPVVHILGKDILKFHIYTYPALLHALSVNINNIVLLVHGWITQSGKKISKSSGAVFDYTNYDSDILGLYLIGLAPLAHDREWNNEDYQLKAKYWTRLILNILHRLLGISPMPIRITTSASLARRFSYYSREIHTAMSVYDMFSAVHLFKRALQEIDTNIQLCRLWDKTEAVGMHLFYYLRIVKLCRFLTPTLYKRIVVTYKIVERDIIFISPPRY